MVVFTEISFEEAEAFVSALGLGSLRGMEGRIGHNENTNYFIDTSGGDYVLTLFERMSFEQLPFYLHLTKHLARHDIPVPCPVFDANGEILHELKGKPAVLVNKLPGASEMAPTLAHGHMMADMLARMHLAGTDYSRFQSNPRGLAWWNTTVSGLLPHVTANERSLMSDELSLQNHIAASQIYADLPKGIVHTGLFRNKVLFEDGKLSGFLDFHFAGIDTFLYDIGVCLNDWCVHPATGRDDPDSVSTFLGAYQGVRKLTPQELQLLPALRRAGALCVWLSRLYDFHLSRQASILKVHDPLHFERILRSLRSTHPLG